MMESKIICSLEYVMLIVLSTELWIITGNAEMFQNITRCNGLQYDVVLCPLDKVVNITSVRAGLLMQTGTCSTSASDCALEITSENYGGKYEEILTKCQGRSACQQRLFPVTVNLNCNGTIIESDYMVIDYQCVQNVDSTDLRHHSLCRTNYFHTPLCPVGTHISVYDVYFGLRSSSVEGCTPSPDDCLFANDNQQYMNSVKGYCDGKIACSNNPAIPAVYSCQGTRRSITYMVVQYTCVNAGYGDVLYIPIPVNTVTYTAICPIGSAALTHEAYLVANLSTAASSSRMIIATQCIEPYVSSRISTQCDGRMACSGLSLPSQGIRCPIVGVFGTHVLIVYTCTITPMYTAALESSLSCSTDRRPEVIRCPDNAILINDILIGFNSDSSCDNETSYQIGDCIRDYKALGTSLYGEVVTGCDGAEHCIPEVPMLTGVSCNGVRHSVNDYFLILYQCQQVKYTAAVCTGDHLNITCSAGNAIHVERVRYILTDSARSLESQCPFVPDDTSEICSEEIRSTSLFYQEFLTKCENAQSCDDLLSTAYQGNCSSPSDNMTEYVEIEYFCKNAATVPDHTTDVHDHTTITPEDATEYYLINTTTAIFFEAEAYTNIWLYAVLAVVGVVMLIVIIVVSVIVTRRQKRRRQVASVMHITRRYRTDDYSLHNQMPDSPVDTSSTEQVRESGTIKDTPGSGVMPHDKLNTDNKTRAANITSLLAPSGVTLIATNENEFIYENSPTYDQKHVPYMLTDLRERPIIYDAVKQPGHTGDDCETGSNSVLDVSHYQQNSASHEHGTPVIYSVAQKRISDDDSTLIVDNSLYSSSKPNRCSCEDNTVIVDNLLYSTTN